MRFTFNTDYDLVPATVNKRSTENATDMWNQAATWNSNKIVASDNEKDPALWWGQSLMFVLNGLAVTIRLISSLKIILLDTHNGETPGPRTESDR
jgi:hypothetical protein